jgi:hypothetical protein
VVYQQGQFIDQYTVIFNREVPSAPGRTGGPEFEQAIIRAQFSPKFFKELVKFEVDLNSVPIGDKTNKDITVNWKFYDSFDPKGEFWTDSNGL